MVIIRPTPCTHLGRVAMLACMGYIAPEYFRLPGLCSPSKGKLPQSLQLIMLRRIAPQSNQFMSVHKPHDRRRSYKSYCIKATHQPRHSLSGVAFADIPNGVQALYKMPAEAGGRHFSAWRLHGQLTLPSLVPTAILQLRIYACQKHHCIL